MASIFVGNLPWRISEQELGDAFSQHGQVMSVRIVSDRETGRSRGFGYVEMSNEDEQEAAINAMNGFELMGRQIRTDKANSRGGR